MGNERPFGVAGGAAGVNQHSGVVGRGVHQLELGRTGLQRLSPIEGAVLGSLHGQDLAQRRALAAHLAQGRHRAGVTDGHHGLAVLQTKGQRLGAEELRQRHAHRAHLQDRHVGHGGLEALGHDDGHAVTALHAQPLQGVRQAVGLGLQLGVGVRLVRAVGRGGHHGHATAALGVGGPAARAHLGHVEAVGHRPAKAAVQSVVSHLVSPRVPL